METLVIIIRFLVIFIISLLYGIERQKAHKPIGFGTFIFVAVGACGLAIAAITIHSDNPLPLLSGIVTGIGFLGAGALIKTTDKIFGFTTAASIWVFAIIGLLIGLGEYLIGLIIYFLVWMTIGVDRYLESRGIGSYQKKLVIKTNKIVPEKELRKALITYTKKHKLISIEIDKGNSVMTATYLIEGRKQELNRIPNILYNTDWLGSCLIE